MSEHDEQAALVQMCRLHEGQYMNTKVCSKCGTELPATTDNFAPHKLGKYGVSAECRPCLRLRYADYRRRNMKKISANARNYHKAHPEWSKQTKKRWYEKYKDDVIQKTRQYRKDNPDYWRAGQRHWAAKYANRRARRLNAGGRIGKYDVLEKYIRQRGLCFYCNCDVSTGFHIDHYIPLSKGGTNDPSNIVIACPSCNLEKGDKFPDQFKRVARATSAN